MARGLAIISTAVGEIPLHIKNGVNGFLIENVSDAEEVVQQVVQHVETLNKDRVLLNSISKKNTEYAYTHFGMDRFNKEYQQLFLEANGS
jgi:glycosyltransferase involved in cell wall biosynthesis